MLAEQLLYLLKELVMKTKLALFTYNDINDRLTKNPPFFFHLLSGCFTVLKEPLYIQVE